MYLVIDTATKDLGVALMDETEVVGQFHWRTKQNHSAELVPAILHLLGKADMGLHDLKGFVVSLGPGGFSGLRVGMTTAKGFAVSTGSPLVAVDTLDASAFPFVGLGAPVCSLLPVGRGEVAAASYRMYESEMEKTTEDRVTTLEALAELVSDTTIFCGAITQEMETELRDRLGGRALIPQAVARASRAVCMGDIGIGKMAKGEVDDPVTLQPFYLRRPSISKPTRPPGG